VGIEDPVDLIDDLEHALIDAGAIAFDAQQSKYSRVVPSTNDELNRAVQKLGQDEADQQEWFVSAPGKIILFGEHAVVHGVVSCLCHIQICSDSGLQTAVAASVDLRCYGLTTPRNDGKLSVHFADIDNFYHEWDTESLPWDAVTPLAAGEDHPDVLDQVLIDAICDGPLKDLGDDAKHAKTASLAFLYMYLMLSHPRRPSFNFTARATLPVGAGLGSSASFSTCAATTLLLVNRAITLPPPPQPADDTHVHISHQGRRFIPLRIAEYVNRWAFVAEKVLHGNPSGVDNSVAVFGGALAYTRAGFSLGGKGGMEPIQG
jgi:mevalonate kinase